MFANIRRSIGLINVHEEKNQITIEGFPANVFISDIYKTWATSKIEQHMFTKASRNSITFHKFFGPDVLYMLETLRADPKRHKNYRAVASIIEKLHTNTWMSRLTATHPDIMDFKILSKFKKSPLPEQRAYLDSYNTEVPRMGLTGYPLAAAAGSGKTICSLMAAECLQPDVIIVLTPKNAIERVWGATIRDEYVTPPEYWSSYHGGEPTPGKRIYVLHYEYLEKVLHFFSKQQYKNPVLIVDECHNFNDPKSSRTQMLCDLALKHLKTNHSIPMSGTPIKAIGNEAIPMLRICDPLFDRFAEARFVEIFGRNAKRGIDILRARLDMIMFKVEGSFVNERQPDIEQRVSFPGAMRYTLANVRELMAKFIAERGEYYRINMSQFLNDYREGLKWYQGTLSSKIEKEDFEKYCSYADDIRKFYDPKIMKDMVVFCNRYELKHIIPSLPKDMQSRFKNARSVYKYINLKIMGEALGGVLGRMRGECHVDMIPHSNLPYHIEEAETKTVIFTSFVEVVVRMDAYLRQEGFKPVLVYGDTNKNLSSLIQRFADDPDANPIIATYPSLSTAVPLTMASTAIFHNAPFREHEMIQARARVDRRGQDAVVRFVSTYLDTQGEPNISTRSKDIMEWSRQQVESIMGIKTSSDVAIEDLSDTVGIHEDHYDYPDDVHVALESAFTSTRPKVGFTKSTDPSWLKW